ncbi:MAG: capsule biosynthesis protein [Methylobacteriaceae bacterium]|nr:capsule biosynthesis protein [Methylobacteriaceae bacterium]
MAERRAGAVQLPGGRTIDGEARIWNLPLAGSGGLILSFLLFVLLPTVGAGWYYGFYASRMFVSEAKFAVRGSVEKLPSTSSNSIMMMGSVATVNSNQDAYIVSSYIQSPAILTKLSESMDLRRLYARDEIDFLARLDAKAPMERLRKYWNKMVIPSVDTLSGVVTLEVKSFSPDESLSLARAILKESEGLVNEISLRKRNDTVRFAAEEVAKAEDRLRAARLAIQTFRNEAGVLDPLKQAEGTLRLLLVLRAQKIDLENEVATARRTLAEDAPSVQTLTTRLRSLNEQIAQYDSQLTSQAGGDKTASRILARYESLELEREFSEKFYVFAQAAYERARVEADRQQLYLVTFVPPALAERSLYPKRVGDTLVVFATAAAIWAVLALLVAAVRDHDV